MAHADESSGQRWTRYALWIYVTLGLVFLMAPILIIVPLSFSAGSFLYFPLPGLSLRWYAGFFTSDLWLPSLRNSLIVGIEIGRASCRGREWISVGAGSFK